MPPSVAVGVDGSDASLVALRWALTAAAVRGADLLAVIARARPFRTAIGIPPDSPKRHRDLDEVSVGIRLAINRDCQRRRRSRSKNSRAARPKCCWRSPSGSICWSSAVTGTAAGGTISPGRSPASWRCAPRQPSALSGRPGSGPAPNRGRLRRTGQHLGRRLRSRRGRPTRGIDADRQQLAVPTGHPGDLSGGVRPARAERGGSPAGGRRRHAGGVPGRRDRHRGAAGSSGRRARRLRRHIGHAGRRFAHNRGGSHGVDSVKGWRVARRDLHPGRRIGRDRVPTPGDKTGRDRSALGSVADQPLVRRPGRWLLPLSHGPVADKPARRRPCSRR